LAILFSAIFASALADFESDYHDLNEMQMGRFGVYHGQFAEYTSTIDKYQTELDEVTYGEEADKLREEGFGMELDLVAGEFKQVAGPGVSELTELFHNVATNYLVLDSWSEHQDDADLAKSFATIKKRIDTFVQMSDESIDAMRWHSEQVNASLYRAKALFGGLKDIAKGDYSKSYDLPYYFYTQTSKENVQVEIRDRHSYDNEFIKLFDSQMGFYIFYHGQYTKSMAKIAAIKEDVQEMVDNHSDRNKNEPEFVALLAKIQSLLDTTSVEKVHNQVVTGLVLDTYRKSTTALTELSVNYQSTKRIVEALYKIGQDQIKKLEDLGEELHVQRLLLRIQIQY